MPVAYVQTRPGHDVTADELRTFLTDQIAAYKIPARIRFRDHLPLTASGKIDRRALRER